MFLLFFYSIKDQFHMHVKYILCTVPQYVVPWGAINDLKEILSF